VASFYVDNDMKEEEEEVRKGEAIGNRENESETTFY
jgi:hypothetical protein